MKEEQLHIDQWEPYETQTDLSPVEALQNIVDYLDRNGQNSFHGSTQIIIAPGYEYKIVKMLVTNSISLKVLYFCLSVLLFMETGKIYMIMP